MRRRPRLDYGTWGREPVVDVEIFLDGVLTAADRPDEYLGMLTVLHLEGGDLVYIPHNQPSRAFRMDAD